MNRLKADWISGVLIGLFLSIQASAMYLSSLTFDLSTASTGGSEPTAPTQETALLSAGELILIAAVEIGLLLLAYRGYRRLPERWQQRIATVLKFSLYSLLYAIGFLFAYAYGVEYLYLLGMPVLYLGFRKLKAMLSSSGLKWVAFNLVAVLMGVFIVTVGGLNLSPRLVIVVMLAFMVYDHIAVNLTNIMGDFVQMSSASRFPNFLIVPSQLRVDLGTIHSYIEGEKDEKPDELAVMIGLGDFIFPSVLVVSAFVAAESVTPAVVTTILGIAVSVFVLRAALEQAEGGLPALPYLCSGGIIGYAIGILPVIA